MKRLSYYSFAKFREQIEATLFKKSEDEIELEDAWDKTMRSKWGNIFESKTPKDCEVNDYSGHFEKYTENLVCNLCGQLYTQYQGDNTGCPYCGNEHKEWLTTSIS